jgi:hypothetical protein
MEKLFDRHVFAYWQAHKKKRANRKPSIEDIRMMDYFKSIAIEHMKSVLKDGMNIVYDDHGQIVKGTIQSTHEDGVLVNDKIVSFYDLYYVIY